VSPTSRLIVNAVLRLILLGFGMWIALADSALPPGTSMITRVGLVIVFLALSILVGEIGQMREHMGMLLKVLRAAQPGRRDDKEAVDILIQGLASPDAGTREKAHHHLKRLTGLELPAEAAAWSAWWKQNRETFVGLPTRN
jgi:hypothetical protein